MLADCWHEKMALLTIRNVPLRLVNSLKSLAQRKQHSMEHEVRELLEQYVSERNSVMEQIEAARSRQKRRPTATRIDKWIVAGRQ
jgi:plasmid stability protein